MIVRGGMYVPETAETYTAAVDRVRRRRPQHLS